MDTKSKSKRDSSRSRSRSKEKKKDKKSRKEKRDSKPTPEKAPVTASPIGPAPGPQEKKEELEEPPKIHDSDLIPALREDVSFLAKKYNEEKLAAEKKKEEEKGSEVAQLRRRPENVGRAGGIYIPPFKLAQLQKEILATSEANSLEHQKLMWELLRKSINGIINKVNIANIQNVIVELLNENLIRGKGLLARAIIKAQMASPNFTHVYAALISVINTKLPEIANLIIRRVILQFQRAFKRNNKIVCMATTKMIAHLINQQVLSDFVGLQMLALLLENPTEDSVDIACDFMIEVGQVLSELTPAGVNAIFERFKSILHEGEIDRKVQYSIENLFAIRKTKFKEHPGIIPELDLVEAEDQIIHNISLEDEIDGEEMLNIFRFDPFYQKTEDEWEQIKREILGEENILRLKQVKRPEDLAAELAEQQEAEEAEKIMDFTEKDMGNLRRTIYLIIMNSLNHEECAHKILKMNIGVGHEIEVCNMLIECCMHERTYMRFYGLLAERFCVINELYKEQFMNLFVEKYTTIHRYETNKLRNIAKMFAHLLVTEAIEWRVLSCITVTQEMTTSSSRIFIKILFQELSEHFGIEKLNERLHQPEAAEYTQGVFPKDHPKNVRFSINFFTSIGLGGLTEDSRKFLDNLSQMFMMNQGQMESEESDETSSSSDSESDSNDSESSSDESSSEEEEEVKQKDSPKQSRKQRPEKVSPPYRGGRTSHERDRHRDREKNRDKDERRDSDRDRDDRKRGRDHREKEDKRDKRRVSRSTSHHRKSRRHS